AKEIPSMCFDILSGLANCKNPFPVKTWREYVQYVKDEIIPDICENESGLQKATEYLQNIGEICILKVPQIQAAASEDPASPSVELDDLRQSRIVLRPQWLCRNIFGRLLAPDCFSHRLVSVDPRKDTYSKETMHKAFSGVLNDVEKLIQLLVILELCYEIEGEVLIP
ncbi:death-associated protein kinase 1-like, partial [Anneissia japonica]|uniref:death-associated protein kinase 1-like n=1 Tax=Anneissia japonica TaxID=1529436 RepID=UPI001425AF64